MCFLHWLPNGRTSTWSHQWTYTGLFVYVLTRIEWNHSIEFIHHFASCNSSMFVHFVSVISRLFVWYHYQEKALGVPSVYNFILLLLLSYWFCKPRILYGWMGWHVKGFDAIRNMRGQNPTKVCCCQRNFSKSAALKRVATLAKKCCILVFKWWNYIITMINGSVSISIKGRFDGSYHQFIDALRIVGWKRLWKLELELRKLNVLDLERDGDNLCKKSSLVFLCSHWHILKQVLMRLWIYDVIG